MKRTKTIKIIEKILPRIKVDLKDISTFAEEFPDCNYLHFTPKYYNSNANHPKQSQFKSKVDSLVGKIENLVPDGYQVSMHNECSHYAMQLVAEGYGAGPGYIHVAIKSTDEGEYCISKSGYVWQNYNLCGRILKSGKIKYGRVSYGGIFMFDDTIKRIQKEREMAKIKKASV